MEESFQAVRWAEGAAELLDQRLLPGQEQYLRITTAPDMAAAITDMVVRGAPAIGVAAAYGVVLAARSAWSRDGAGWLQAMEPDLHTLEGSRPTAVNLHWAIRRMRECCARIQGEPEPELLREALAIHEEDRAANRRMGELGADVIGDTGCVLTHCNAGALATGGYGTALGVIRTAFSRGGLHTVYAAETRPWLQGARLTAWELGKDGVPVTLIADSAAASLMQSGTIGWVIVGADRIAANGDVANKIGTYSHAVAARHHGIRFMVVAPVSTIDPATATGAGIPVEQRDARELVEFRGQPIAAPGTRAFNPVFDVTPASLVDVIVTEKGIIHAPDRDAIAGLLQG